MSLHRRDVLVSVQDILRIILLLKFLQTSKCLQTKCCTHSLDWLIRLHIVDVSAAAVRPRLNRCRTLASPSNLFGVESMVLPDCHHTDVERSMAEAHRSRRGVSIFGSTME